MVPVLFLFLCFVSPAFLDNVPIHRNLTRKSSESKPNPLLPSLQHLFIGNEQSTSQTNSKVQEQLPTSKCPNTELLLKILSLLTQSLPDKVVEPQKLKDVIFAIKILLTKASVNNDINNLSNEIKVLEDQLVKIKNTEDEEGASHKENERSLKAKLSLQYDVPNKCEHILYALVNFINNAYSQVAKYCTITGNCNVGDLPNIKYDTVGLPNNLNKLIQNNPYYNPNVQGPGASINSNVKYNNVYDLIKSLPYSKPNSEPVPKPQNLLNSLIPQNGNVNSNKVPDKSLNSPVGLYPEWMLYDSNNQIPINNPMSSQDIYSIYQNYMKLLAEKLKRVEIPNKDQQNIKGTIESDLLSVLQSGGKRQPQDINKQANAGGQVSPPYGSVLKQPDLLNYNNIYQLLYAVKPQPDVAYVTPDTLNTTPDKNKQYVQLPDPLHYGVTDQDKLNTIGNQNEVVELTYMLKRPKLAYEPLYYVKYRVPYHTFVYNLQKLLSKNPYLRNDPSKLYQELLLHSNITEASGDLRNLEQEELVKLIASNGTLVTAKMITGNDTQSDRLDLVQKSIFNVSPRIGQSAVNVSSIMENLIKLANNVSMEHDFSQRLALNPYYVYNRPSKTKSPFQTNLNYYPGNVFSSGGASSNIYGRPSIYSYGASKNVPQAKAPSYSVYQRGYKTG